LKGSLRVYLFTSFAGDLIVPLYSLYLPLLAALSGATVAEVGIVGGASYISYSFMPFIAGRYSDRMKIRRGFILAALGVLAVVSLSYLYVATPLQLIAARVGEGVGWAMLWPTVQAAIAEDTQMEASKSLSIYNTIWSAAAAIGPLVGVVLLLFYQSIRTIFVFSIILLLAAVAVNLLPTRRESRRKEGFVDRELSRRIEPSPVVHPLIDIRASYSSWFYKLALVYVMAVRGVLLTFALPLARSTGTSVLLIGEIAIFFGVSRFVTYVFTLRDDIRGWLLATANIRRNVVVGLVLASLGGGLPVIPDKSGATFLASFIIVGVAASVVTAISQTEMLRLDPNKRGEKAGLQESSIGVGVAFGPIVSGLMSGGSYVVPFFFPLSGILLVIPTLLLGTRQRAKRQIVMQPEP
jgi:MFS family permease